MLPCPPRSFFSKWILHDGNGKEGDGEKEETEKERVSRGGNIKCDNIWISNLRWDIKVCHPACLFDKDTFWFLIPYPDCIAEARANNGGATPESGIRRQKIERGGGWERGEGALRKEGETKWDQRGLEEIDREGGGRREERRPSSKYTRLGPLLSKRS